MQQSLHFCSFGSQFRQVDRAACSSAEHESSCFDSFGPHFVFDDEYSRIPAAVTQGYRATIVHVGVR